MENDIMRIVCRRVLRWGRGPILRTLGILAVCLSVPLLMGGCPTLRNTAVDGLETAARDVLNTALDIAFDGFRANGG